MSKLTINTNLASLVTQKNLKTSTNRLQQAIDRLTTGVKINSSSDNAANYAIATDMESKMNSYQVAEDNVMSGIDMLDTASSTLNILEDRLERLRFLQMQAQNGTFGERQLEAINSECNALIDEISSVYGGVEYNGISLLQTQYSSEEVFAESGTTFAQLGIEDSSFQIYDSDDNLVQAYYTLSTDTLGTFLGALRTHGFTADIVDGRISLASNDYYYVAGDLANQLGISQSTLNVIERTTQNSTGAATYAVTALADGDSTFSQIGVLSYGTQNVNIRNGDGTLAGNVTVNADMNLDTFFTKLTGFGITGTINDGVITLNSPSGAYLESGGIVSALGISVQTDSTNTIGKSQTSTLPITKTETITTPQTTETTSVETTTTIWTTTTTNTTSTETIWTTTTTGSTQTITLGTTQTSTALIKYTTVRAATLQSIMDSLEDFADESIQEMSDVQARVESGGLVSVITQMTSAPSGYTWVTTADELQAALTANQNICLGADIDMSTLSSAWVMKESYSGNFDGNGYTIKNFSIESSATNVGLIASTSSDAFLKNIRMENIDVTGTAASAKVGGLVGSICSSCTIDNVAIVSGSVTASGTLSYAGGIAGSFNSTTSSLSYSSISITNCYNSGAITSTSICGGIVGYSKIDTSNTSYSYYASLSITKCYNFGTVSGNNAGGITGYAQARFSSSPLSITNCYNSGSVSGSSLAGGITGYTSNISLPITNCYNSGSVSGSSHAGGIVGMGSISTITNCYNSGSVTASGSSSSAGGILGISINNGLSHFSITSCYNSGTVSGQSVGGILGKTDYSSPSLSITNCYNSGSVTGPYNYSRVGGILGATDSSSSSITNCYNSGAITSSISNAGGILGATDSSSSILSITNCYNSGTVTSSYSYSNAGGILGATDSSSSINNCVNSSSNTSKGLVGRGSPTITNSYYNNALTDSAGGIATSQSDAQSRIAAGLNQDLGGENVTTSIKATDATTLTQLGLSSSATISYKDSTGTHLETFSTSSTLGTIKDWLEDAGFGWSFDNGTLTITGGDNLYITSFDSALSTALKLSNNWTTTEERDTTVTTTISTTNTIETTTTTTTSTTQTETVYTTTTIPGTSTTNTITMTTGSTFGDFGLSGERYVTIHVGATDKIVTVKQSDTVAQLISALGGSNSVTASLTDGILTLSPSGSNVYITGISDELRNLLNLDNSYYNVSYNYSNTNSATLNESTTKTIQGSTSLSEAGVTGNNVVIRNDNGSYATVSIAGCTNFNDFINRVGSFGITMTLVDGLVNSYGLGECYLTSGDSNILGKLNLSGPNYITETKNSNSVRGRVGYYTMVENTTYAPEEIILQVGINADENSRISVKLGLEWEALNSLRRIGLDLDTDFLSRIDELLGAVSLKQTEIGATQNRLLSVAEQINIAYENLVSSHSTIKDADISKVTGDYLRNQILQQASVTLLATANQSPSIALQLI